MEKIPAHSLLEFHPDTFEYVRKDLGLDKPGQMDAAIDLLDDWVKKQAHFTKKDFPREYLERTIIFDKGSVERAKLQMDKLFTMRSLAPSMFERTDINNFKLLQESYVDALLPKLTKDHYRIYCGKLLKDDFDPVLFPICYGFGAMYLEHIKALDFCAGFIGIIDYRHISLYEVAAKVNILELRQFITLMMEGYHMRVKGVHILTTSKTVDILLRILKQVFSKKIGDRIRIHMTQESLHEYFPKDVLPKEFGGELKSLIEMNNDWFQLLLDKENLEYYKDMRKATVNEKLRNDVTNGNNDILGISGSFKTLCVD